MALLKDLALSHVLSRNQIIALGYFTSVTRLNTRLRKLRESGMVRTLPTPFFQQSLYAVDQQAKPFMGDRLNTLIANRGPSPRFLQHALSITNVRISLSQRGATAWRFEQQLWTAFDYLGSHFIVLPAGMAVIGNDRLLIEVDLGHVAPLKFRQKLLAYDAFLLSGACKRLWGMDAYSLLTVTTGKQRARTLSKLMPSGAAVSMQVKLFEELGATFEGCWS